MSPIHPGIVYGMRSMTFSRAPDWTYVSERSERYNCAVKDKRRNACV